MPQLSDALPPWAWNSARFIAGAGTCGRHATSTSGGHVMLGGSSSLISMICVQSAVLPQVSVAR